MEYSAIRVTSFVSIVVYLTCGIMFIIYEIKKSRENSFFFLQMNLQNFPIHVIMALYIDVSLYLTLTIQESSRLKRSFNHLWNSSDVCRKTFGK